MKNKTEEPEPAVPSDICKALAAAAPARKVWFDVTPVPRRDWIQWITSGKRAETRALRIAKACDNARQGKAASVLLRSVGNV